MTSFDILPGVTARCRSCGAPILWAATSRGKATPLDAEPVADGEWQLEGSPARAVPAGMFPGPRYRVHWATCTTPEQFRRAR